MRIDLDEREALLIVTALGTYQNRIGQKAGWFQRKRKPTLNARLADAMIIGAHNDCDEINRARRNTDRIIERAIALGHEVSALRERVKETCGVDTQKVNNYPKDETI